MKLGKEMFRFRFEVSAARQLVVAEGPNPRNK